jgi:Spy/CpxP family protein refolding chaperone
MPSKRWMYRSATVLSLMAAVAPLSCAASRPVPATAASSPPIDDDRNADLYDRHRHHAQGGVTMFVALSLDTLGLPPEQQAVVTQIQSELFAKMEPARAGQQNLLTALADGVAAGAIDEARVNAAVAQLESASGQVHEATVDALNRLHAALTPPERAALVDKVWAHWSIFQQANVDDDHGGKDGQGGHLADLAKEVGLSADQVATIARSLQATAQVEPVTEDPAAIDAHLKRLGAFREDTFDARTLTGGSAANARVAVVGARRMAHFYETVSPVLTPEQRPKVALLLREHAGHQDVAVPAAATAAQ